MAIGSPRQWNVGDLLTAALMNVVSSILNFVLNPDAAEAHQTSGQTILNATATAITLDTVDQNVNGVWSAGANTRFTAQTAATYRCSGAIGFPSNATGLREAYWRVNGTTVAVITNLGFGSAAAAGTVAAPTIRVHLNVGDYVELIGYQASGGSLTLITAPLSTYGLVEYAANL